MSVIYLDTEKGKRLFEKAEIDFNVFRWINFQINATFCGVASAVVALNAAGVEGPVDQKFNGRKLFTQENIFETDFGSIVSQSKVFEEGMSLAELGAGLRLFGAVKVNFAEIDGRKKFEEELIESLEDLSQGVVIVNYDRQLVSQEGGGHFSPILAYEKESGMVLLNDVASYRYPSTWIELSDLFGICSREGDPRGYLIFKKGG